MPPTVPHGGAVLQRAAPTAKLFPPFSRKNTENYVASIQWKRELHKTNATTMIETFAFENFEGVLTSELENKLKEKNVSFAPMSGRIVAKDY